MTVIGKIIEVSPLFEFNAKNGSFKKRQLVIEAGIGKNYVAFSFIQEDVAKLDNLSVGDNVAVNFGIFSRKATAAAGEMWYTEVRGFDASKLSETL